MEASMKTLSMITTLVILSSSSTVNADSSNAADKKPVDIKSENIETLLADQNRTQGKVARRIRTHLIDTWRRLDNRHIFIDGKGRKNDYLIKFKNKCYSTRNGSTLIYKTNNSELTKHDSIGVLDSFIYSHDVLRPTRSCLIEDIYHLDVLTTDKSTISKKDKKNTHKKKNKNLND